MMELLIALAYSVPVGVLAFGVLLVGEHHFNAEQKHPAVLTVIRAISATVMALLLFFCCSFYSGWEELLSVGLVVLGVALLLVLVSAYLVARAHIYRKQRPALPPSWQGAWKTIRLGIAIGALLGAALIFVGRSEQFETYFREIGWEGY